MTADDNCTGMTGLVRFCLARSFRSIYPRSKTSHRDLAALVYESSIRIDNCGFEIFNSDDDDDVGDDADDEDDYDHDEDGDNGDEFSA